MLKITKLLIVLPLFLVALQISAKTEQINSPDKRISVQVFDTGGVIGYAVFYNGIEVFTPSKLGLVFNHKAGFEQSLSIDKAVRNSHQAQWQQPWGERKLVEDNHNELLLTFKPSDNKAFDVAVRIRVFNDGMGIRYEGLASEEQEVEIVGDLTEFAFAQSNDVEALWIPSRGWNRYEFLYQRTPLTDISIAHTPATFTLPNNIHVSIHEAALVDFAAMSLDQRRPGILKANLAPRSDGLKVKTHGQFKSSWRTIQLADKAVGLLNSDLILNLNEANKLGDVSWVKPGKYVGIWWAMHLYVNTWGSGDKHGATTELTKSYIDFAAKYGFDGVLVEGWNLGWDGSWFNNGDVFSFTQSYPDFDIQQVSQYGKELGVKLIGHHETSGSISNYEKQMDAAYDLYQSLGVSQVKTGYVADGGDAKRVDENGLVRKEWHDSQIMVNHYLHSVKQAAKRHISINTHEPIKDTGLRRTYPNWLSREGARGQEFNAWGSPPNPPEHTVNLVYTRMLSGPMDFTPGIFNLAFEGLDAENRVQTTLAKQLALYVVLYSPIQMAADLPQHYEQNLAPFQFIQDVPTDWENSIALDGEVGDFAVFARQQRDADDWYVGAITDENARSIIIDLSFLSEGREYQAQIYQDGKDADYKSNPYAIDINTKTVNSTNKLTLNLATSGGVAIRFKAL